MKLKCVVLSLGLFVGGVCAMDPDLEAQLSEKPVSETQLLLDLMCEKYGINSQASKDVIFASVQELPHEKLKSFLKAIQKRGKHSQGSDETSQELIKALVKGLEVSADLQRKSSVTAQKQLEFTKVASVTGAVVSLTAIVLSNLLNYYLTH